MVVTDYQRINMSIKSSGKKYGGVYESKLKNGTVSYYIQYKDEENATRTKKCDAKNKDEALIQVINKRVEVKKNREKIAKGEMKLNQQKRNRTLTLDQYAKIFHDTRENKDAKAELGMYNNHISPLIGKKKITKLTKDDLIKFRKDLGKKKVETTVVTKTYTDDGKEIRKTAKEQRELSPTTIKHLLDYLRVILNNAIDDGYSDSSPLDFSECKDRTRQIAEKKKIYGEEVTTNASDNESGRVLTDDELIKLWNLDELKMNDRLNLFLKTCYFTGARPAGVIDIKVKDIDFTNKKIKIKAMKKGKSYQSNAKSNDLLSLLGDWIRKYSLAPDNYIFFPIQSYSRASTEEARVDAKNKAANYSGYRRYLQKIFDPAFNVGTDSRDRMNRVNVYSMRRTSATKVYKKHGIVHAKEFLNHTDIKTTMYYLNITGDMEDIDYGL